MHLQAIALLKKNNTDSYVFPEVRDRLPLDLSNRTVILVDDGLVLDNDGNVVNEITYDAFGNITVESNPDINFRFSYTG